MNRPRGKRRRWGRAVAALAAVAALGIVLCGTWLVQDWRKAYGAFPKDGIFLEIPRGSATGTIARMLAASGVVRSSVSFQALAARHSRQKLRAGEYFFDRPRTPQEVFRILAEGRVFLHTVTVPEGYTMFDIADLLEKERLVRREAFLAAAGDTGLIHDLAPEARNLEGFLFPDTYKFPRGTPPQKIVEAMVRRFRTEWDRLPSGDTDAPALSAFRVVTLASLVEKETGVAEERPLVASVFYNRLRRGIALDCDPTVIYALRLAGQYNGTLGSADLGFASPYNTYRNRGLPPGPIANPGEASLRAAHEPRRTGYFYFVADAEGGHVFSRTLAEHHRNVSRYRRRLNKTARNDAPSGKAPPTKGRHSP